MYTGTKSTTADTVLLINWTDYIPYVRMELDPTKLNRVNGPEGWHTKFCIEL